MLRPLSMTDSGFQVAGRRRAYLGAFALLTCVFYAMALTAPQGDAELAVFWGLAQLAALAAGLAVYTRVSEGGVAVAEGAAEIETRPAGREGLRRCLGGLLKQAEESHLSLDVAVMLIEPDQAHTSGSWAEHGFERVKLAVQSRSGRAQMVELSESCVALALCGASASYELEVIAQALLRDLRDFRQNELGMKPVNLTFGIGVCSGERSSVDSLAWQARVALRRAYDLGTGIYVVSNRSDLAKRI